jgi:hypothetical protein
MTTFEELFKKFNPMSKSQGYELGCAHGAQSALERVLFEVNALDVDSFDDICYKSDVLDIIKKHLSQTGATPWTSE